MVITNIATKFNTFEVFDICCEILDPSSGHGCRVESVIKDGKYNRKLSYMNLTPGCPVPIYLPD